MRLAATLLASGFLVASALLPTGGRTEDPEPEWTGWRFTDPTLPGVEAWLEPSVADGVLTVKAVAHRAAPGNASILQWECGRGSWASRIVGDDARGIGLPAEPAGCEEGAVTMLTFGDRLERTVSWNGSRPLAEEQGYRGWALAPGAYVWVFSFLAYDGLPHILPADEVPAPPIRNGEPADAAWGSITILLPVDVGFDGSLRVGEQAGAWS